MLHTNIKKYRFILEFNLISNSIDIESHKQIKYIKEKAIKLFYRTKNDLKLTYCNKDLTPYETISIGEYFKGKNNINIKLIECNVESRANTSYKEESHFIDCVCKRSQVKNFCRQCNQFLCDSCKIDVFITLLRIHIDIIRQY